MEVFDGEGSVLLDDFVEQYARVVQGFDGFPLGHGGLGGVVGTGYLEEAFDVFFAEFADEAAHAGGGGWEAVVVVADEGDDGVEGVVVGFEAVQDVGGHFGALLGVAVEVSPAVFSHGEAGGFGDVVHQHGEAQDGVGGDGLDGVGDVGPDVVDVVGVVLLKADGGGEFRDDGAEDFREGEQHAQGALAAEDAFEFGEDALGADVGQQVAVAPDGVGGFGFDGKVVAGGKAQGAQDAQAVFVEAGVGFADAADDAGGQVFLAAKGIH